MASMPNFPVRDLKMEAVTKLAIEDWDFPTPKNSNVESTLVSFHANISRVRLLMLMPTSVAGATQMTQRAQDIAEIETAGHLVSKSETSPEMIEKIEKRRVEILDADIAQINKMLGTPDGDEFSKRHHHEFAQALKGLATNPLAASGFVELLAAHVTGTWTAIESVLGDLWETALNCHPATLAALKGKPKRIGGADKSQAGEQGQEHEAKSIPLNLVEMHKFDLRSSMGTVFRRQRRFEFTRLSSVREAYSCAFSEKFGRIDAALSSKSFDALSAVRNVLVHRGGIADGEYVKQCSYLPIPKTLIGKPVRLDGEIVAQLISRAFASSKSLVIAVDDWLDQN